MGPMLRHQGRGPRMPELPLLLVHPWNDLLKPPIQSHTCRDTLRLIDRFHPDKDWQPWPRCRWDC